MNRKVREILVMLVTLSLLTIPGIGQADRGSMPWGFEDNLMPEIFEPAQNAVLASFWRCMALDSCRASPDVWSINGCYQANGCPNP